MTGKHDVENKMTIDELEEDDSAANEANIVLSDEPATQSEVAQ